MKDKTEEYEEESLKLCLTCGEKSVDCCCDREYCEHCGTEVDGEGFGIYDACQWCKAD